VNAPAGDERSQHWIGGCVVVVVLDEVVVGARVVVVVGAGIVVVVAGA